MKRLIIYIVMALPLLVNAQDIHFSQFYNSPLTLNPTLTGLMDGRFRVGAIYRNQWSAVGDPFTTVSASFDANMKGGGKFDRMGLGGYIFYDKAGMTQYSTLNATVSFAYHKALSKNGKHLLSLGVQAGFVQKRLDPAKGTFRDQIDGGLNVVPGSQEEQNIDNVIHEELAVGLSYSGQFGNTKLFLGGSAFHLTQPKEEFLSGSESRLPMRYSGNAGLDIGIGKHFSLLPSAIFMMQAKATELNLGMGFSYEFDNSLRTILGVYYRLDDAVIPMLGLEYKNVNLSFSYDVNTSGLNDVTNSRGGYEISLMFVAPHKEVPYKYPTFFAPRF